MLSDITSSEGILARYSDICRTMKFEVYTSKELHKLIRDRQRLSNEKVRGRHIQIMRNLDLLQLRENRTYKLFTHGKTIIGFEEKGRLGKRPLSTKDKVLYLSLLANKGRNLILPFLERLNHRNLRSRDKVIIGFFRAIKGRNIWPEGTIEGGLELWLKNRQIHRSFENRFRCIEMWLEDLGLIIKKEQNIGISSKGVGFKRILVQVDSLTLQKSIEIISGRKTVAIDINLSNHYRLLKQKILGKYNVLFEPTGFTDIQAMYELTCIELGLEQQIFFPERDLPLLLKRLWDEDLVSSLSKDTDGKLRYFVLRT